MVENLQPNWRNVYFVPLLGTHVQRLIFGQRGAFHVIMMISVFCISLAIVGVHWQILDLLNYLNNFRT